VADRLTHADGASSIAALMSPCSPAALHQAAAEACTALVAAGGAPAADELTSAAVPGALASAVKSPHTSLALFAAAADAVAALADASPRAAADLGKVWGRGCVCVV